jgi:threonyl-tRNA synthetase
VQLADPVGRESTLATIQIDFHQPAQFGLSYTDASGSGAQPVMVHRSLVGSMERLFASLLEIHAGSFPVWYAPVQISVLPIGAEQDKAADDFAAAAIEAGLRAQVDRDSSVGARIRDAAGRKIPYVAVIGPQEAPEGKVAMRLRDGRRLAAMPGAEAIELVGAVSAARSQELLPAG